MAIAIDLTTAVAAGGLCNNGKELVSKTQRPTSQYRSPPFSELGDDRNNNSNSNSNNNKIVFHTEPLVSKVFIQ
jgi:hypothetical protein